MCEKHKPWLNYGYLRPHDRPYFFSLAPMECLDFGGLDGLCWNPESIHFLEGCPQKGRRPEKRYRPKTGSRKPKTGF